VKNASGVANRGFAVVAAKDIKTLIGTSVEKAESGSRLVNEAGTTMQELLAGVTQASSLLAGIAQAGREQSQNLREVNQAITQVDTVTQQNAALVEQTTATAGSLKEQSEHLADTIRKFKLTA
jgi:methyl-accepting chemotaxis protein